MKFLRIFPSSLPSIRYTFRQFDLAPCKRCFHVSALLCHESDALKKRQAEIMARGLPKKKDIPGVRDIVLIVSGKGGVGKSTSAVNVAAALAVNRPSKVGLLDADVFGPSIPLMMNLGELNPEVNKENIMVPLVNYGVKCMSMGFLVSETSAVVWRGLMVMKALEQLTRQVDWRDTDCLIVDTPPGTGDTILSLVQTLPISGVVMVTTPEKLAVQVARRGGTMLQKLGIPIIGIISNMSSVICDNCQTDIPIFGCETQKLASDLGVPILADIPLTYDRDEGSSKPAVVANPTGSKMNSIIDDQCVARKVLRTDESVFGDISYGSKLVVTSLSSQYPLMAQKYLTIARKIEEFLIEAHKT